MVGAELSNDGCIKVDSHQRTSVPGLYAAGDVVIGLDQISHAMGEGGVAATTIRNDLAQTAAAAARAGCRKCGSAEAEARRGIRVEDDPAVLEIGDSRLGTGSASACRPRSLDLEQVAGAVILDGDDRADGLPVAVERRQADQVGVIIFALFERRQRRAIDLDQRAAQRLGRRAVGNAFEARDRASCRRRGRKGGAVSTPPTYSFL